MSRRTIPSPIRSERGFTLIELLVVIAIIAILASLILAALSSAQRGGRDSRRLSDMKQYQTALTSYAAANNGAFPAGPHWPIPTTGITGLSPYMSQVLLGPTRGADPNYYYAYGDPGDGRGARWIMCAYLEGQRNYVTVSRTGIKEGGCTWPLAD